MNMVLANDIELMEVSGGRRGRGAGSGTQEARDQAKHTGGNFFNVAGIATTLLVAAKVIVPPAGFALGLAAGVGSLLLHNME